MGIREVLNAPPSPWQNPFAERLIGSIRRECLDHVLVLGERPLRRIRARHFAYYHQARTHLALDKDAPTSGPSSSPLTDITVMNRVAFVMKGGTPVTLPTAARP
jgi:transposase InsO family protein